MNDNRRLALARLLRTGNKALPDDPLGPDAGLFGVTPAGGPMIHPHIMAQGYRAAQSRYDALVRRGLIDPFAGMTIREDAMPNRNVMNVPSQPFGNVGIHAWPFPGAKMPNAYRGPLTTPGVPGIPEAPEYYVPGSTDQWLRGT